MQLKEKLPSLLPALIHSRLLSERNEQIRDRWGVARVTGAVFLGRSE